MRVSIIPKFRTPTEHSRDLSVGNPALAYERVAYLNHSFELQFWFVPPLYPTSAIEAVEEMDTWIA